MSSSPRHRVQTQQRSFNPLAAGISRRNKVRASFAVAAAAAVAGAVVPFAIGGGTGASAGAAQFQPPHQAQVAQPHATDAASTRSMPTRTSGNSCTSPSTAPTTLLKSSLLPRITNSRTSSPTTLGVQIVPTKSGSITGVAFWKGQGNTGTHTAAVWSNGKQLATGTFAHETASGWQWLTLTKPVQVRAGQSVLATYNAPHGHYAYTPGAFGRSGICSGGMRVLDGFQWTTQAAGHVSPGSRYTSHDEWLSGRQGANYFVNLRFAPSGATTSPTPSQAPTSSSPTAKPTTPQPTTKPTTPPTTPKPTATTASPTPKPTTSPTSKPTSTPTSTPTGGTTTGWPNASNTGVPAGTALHACSGSITASGTYTGCQFSGGVTIGANNVHISKSLINGQVNAGDGKQTGLVISDTEINCHCMSTPSTTPPAVSFSNFTLIRDNIHNAGHGVQINNNATVEDSYIHDLGANNAAHKDAIISNGGGNAVIKHNNVECAADSCSAAIGLFGDFAPIKNWTITDNLLNTTGSYCLYGGDSPGKPYSTATGMVITNNHFGKKDWPKCGQYGPVTAFDHNSGNSWSGNVWDGTNTAIAAN